jgi:tetratricopeptide (TPR) repeat protein
MAWQLSRKDGESRIMKKQIAAITLAGAFSLLSTVSTAQVPDAGEGAPTGICTVWNGKNYESRPCVDESGSRRVRERKGPSPSQQARELDRIGANLYSQGKLEQALAQFQAAARIDPRDGSAYYGVCLINAAWNNFAFAHTNCDLAVRYGTKDVWSIGNSELQRYTNSLLAKLNVQNEAFKRESDENEYQKSKGFFDAMDWERALYFLNFYTDPQQNYTAHLQEALAMKGTALTRRGLFAEAEQALYQAYKVDPERALDAVRQNRHPNLADNLWDLQVSRAHAIQGKDIDSKLRKISLLQQSLRFKPDDFRSLYWLAYAEFRTNYWNEGAKHLEKAQKGFEQNCYMNCGSSMMAPVYVDERALPSSPTIGTLHPAGNNEYWDPPKDVQKDLDGAFRIVNILAQEQLGSARDMEKIAPDKAHEEMADAYTYLSDFQKAHDLYKGLLVKFPDNKEFQQKKEILSRIIVHQPLYINEAKRQAEAAKKNGQDGVLFEIDQNMRCFAGQTFDGAGTCINNGFSWP